MATASSTPSSLDQEFSWHTLEPEARLQLLRELVAAGRSELFLPVLAAQEDIGLAPDTLIELTQDLDHEQLRRIALQTRSKPIAAATVARLVDCGELVDLALKAASVHVRKQAALAISDREQLEALREQVRGKDKTVFRVLEQRLNPAAQASTEPADSEGQAAQPPPEPAARATTPAQQDTEPAPSGKPQAPAATADTQASAAGEPEPTADKAEEKRQAGSITDAAPASAASGPSSTAPETSGLESGQTAANSQPGPAAASTASATEAAAAPDVSSELSALTRSIAKLSFRNSTSLLQARSRLGRLRKQVKGSAEEEPCQQLEQKLKEMLEKNRDYQQQVQQQTEALLAELAQALEEGRTEAAMPAWDRIQGNISNTSGKLRTALNARANEHRARLTELRDWKNFAATEKKKALIQQMQQLLETKMDPRDLSRRITSAHDEWKALGRSRHNDTLWRKFKKLSDQAWEPCKEYFRQRKEVLATNFRMRRQLCDQLQQELAQLSADSLNIGKLNQLLKQAEEEWKKHAPVENARIKPLQKRYYSLVNQLRDLRKNTYRDNARRKQDCIDRAQKLAELQDRQQAMASARDLQQEWKTLGPAGYKEDKKYWEQFRAACDTLFAERKQQQAERKARVQQAQSGFKEIMAGLDELLKLDDEALRAARGAYQELAQRFTESLAPDLGKQRAALLEQFNTRKRKLDKRFKSLPDKKRLALVNQVQQATGFLAELEGRMLASKNDAAFSALQQELAGEGWQQLASISDEHCAQQLNQRHRLLAQATSAKDLNGLAAARQEQARSLCVELEIRAGLDSPAPDQALRMEIQLGQLQAGFGQARPDAAANARFARDAELRSICLGPLETSDPLSERLGTALKRLL